VPALLGLPPVLSKPTPVPVRPAATKLYPLTTSAVAQSTFLRLGNELGFLLFAAVTAPWPTSPPIYARRLIRDGDSVRLWARMETKRPPQRRSGPSLGGSALRRAREHVASFRPSDCPVLESGFVQQHTFRIYSVRAEYRVSCRQ
jgi:hypothetical protein